MAVQKLRLLGDFETYDRRVDDEFEFTNRDPIWPAFTYVEACCDFDSPEFDETCELTELGRCEIGSQWGTPWLYLHIFEISKSKRNKGYGRSFFNELKKFAKEYGFSYIWLSPRDDEGVYSFWECMGGVRAGDLGDVGLTPRKLSNQHFVFDLNADDTTQGE